MAQFLEKCTKWPQMTLTCCRSKIPTCIHHGPLRPKFSSVSLCDEPFSSYHLIFRKKCTEWPQMTLTCSRSKISTGMLHTTPTPKFSSLYSKMSRFRVTAQFSEKCTEWLQMTLTCWRSNIPTCMLPLSPLPETQIFVCFALWWAVFELCPFFWEKCTEWPQNDFNWFVQDQKYQHSCYIHLRGGPNFRQFRSRMSPFRLRPLFSTKCTECPQMTLTCSK